MNVRDRTWEDFEIWVKHRKSRGGLLLWTPLYVSRILWHYWMVWKSYEIFSTSDFCFSTTGLEKNTILGCFRTLSFLIQTSECKVSQLGDTVALYGHHLVSEDLFAHWVCIGESRFLVCGSSTLPRNQTSCPWVYLKSTVQLTSIPRAVFHVCQHHHDACTVPQSSAQATGKFYFPWILGRISFEWCSRESRNIGLILCWKQNCIWLLTSPLAVPFLLWSAFVWDSVNVLGHAEFSMSDQPYKDLSILMTNVLKLRSGEHHFLCISGLLLFCHLHSSFYWIFWVKKFSFMRLF